MGSFTSLCPEGLGEISSAELSLPGEMELHAVSGEHLVVNTVLDGSVQTTTERGEQRHERGDIYASTPADGAFRSLTSDLRIHAVRIPAAALAAVEDRAGDDRWEMPRLLSEQRRAYGVKQWRAGMRFVDELLADPATADSPLLLASAARLLAASVLTVYSRSAEAHERTGRGLDDNSSAFDRAVEFIEANCDLQLTVADVARSAHMSPRAIQLAFRRNLGVTPMHYLRQMRLQGARRQLADAIPEERLTVTRVALDWHFANASRFSQHYRSAFGESPSETLRARARDERS